MNEPNAKDELAAEFEEMRRRNAEEASRKAAAFFGASEDVGAGEGAGTLREWLHEASGEAGGPDVARMLSAAHQEALRVHDSPVRADQLADRLPALARAVAGSDLIEEYRDRIRAHLADAERVLRRDDDGREAARHLDAALRLAERKPRSPSPFLDDP